MNRENDVTSVGAPPRRITIPFLLDVLLVSEPAQIAYFDAHPAIERELDRKASYLHRVMADRMQKALAFDGASLPVFRSRKDRARAEQQQALNDRLDRIRGLPGPEREAIGRYIAGEDIAEPIGVVVQRWCGRLFEPDYQGDAASQAAGRRFAKYPSAPPWVTLVRTLSGRLARDKALLKARARGDLHCIHATSIGTENIVRTVEKMRKAAARSDTKLAAPDEIIRSCLVAPSALIRGVSSTLQAPFLERPLTKKTLVIFRVAKAYAMSGDLDVAFQAGSWSACPARAAVAELLCAVWHAAHHDEIEAKGHGFSSWSRLVARALS